MVLLRFREAIILPQKTEGQLRAYTHGLSVYTSSIFQARSFNVHIVCDGLAL